MNSGPRLAVHVGRQVPDLLLRVLSATTPWCEPVALSSHEPPPHGVVAHLYSAEVLPRSPVEPFAVWRSPGEEVPAVGAAAVLRAAGTPRAGAGELLVSPLPVPSDARPVLPFTRARYRELRGLPARMVATAEGGDPGWTDADSGAELRRAAPDSWPTLAALSGAVAVTGEYVWDALSWAAPVVTDPAAAHHWDLEDGVEVLVGTTADQRRALARTLIDDPARAAGLARRGWEAARDRTIDRVAQQLCRALGLSQRQDLVAEAGLTAALDELGAPRSALIRRRAREATAALPGAVTQGWRPSERTTHART